MQADHPDDLAVNDGDQDVVTISALVQKFTNRIRGCGKAIAACCGRPAVRCNTSG